LEVFPAADTGRGEDDAFQPEFFCDDHCGRLARWLRFVGYDCAHARSISMRRS